MKNHLIISLLILSVGFCQQKKTDEPNPMKGVKILTKSSYHLEEKFGEFIDVLKGKTIHKYDSKGNEVEMSNYDSDGNLEHGFVGVSKTISKYDSDGNEIEESEYDSDGSFKSKTIYKYDSNGNRIEYSHYYDSEGSLSSKTTYKYDDKNRRVEEIRYEYELKFGELQERPTTKTIYEYEEY